MAGFEVITEAWCATPVAYQQRYKHGAPGSRDGNQNPGHGEADSENLHRERHVINRHRTIGIIDDIENFGGAWVGT